LTKKREPEDIDFTLLFHADDYAALSPDMKQMADDLMVAVNTKFFGSGLDGYVTLMCRREDPKRLGSQEDYWAEWWQTDRDGYLKGIAVLKIGDTDVGAALHTQ